MVKRKSRPLRDRLLIPALLFIVVPLGVFAVVKYVASRPSAAPPAAEIREEPKPRREITLYFGAPEGGYLLPEGREIEDCPTDADCLAAVVQALADGPTGDLVPILPAHAVLRGSAVTDGTAVLDFGPELVSAHPGGSMSELLTVYGLADTLAVNFPHIRQLRILVGGEGIDTLRGHVGLREAIAADFSFTRPPEKIRRPQDLPAGGREAAAARIEGER